MVKNEGISSFLREVYLVSVSIKLENVNVANGKLNETYGGHTFGASGGQPPYIYTEDIHQRLPYNMKLSNNGVLSGDPIEDGTIQFGVYVSDGVNTPIREIVTITIDNESLTPNAPIATNVHIDGPTSITFDGTAVKGSTLTAKFSYNSTLSEGTYIYKWYK